MEKMKTAAYGDLSDLRKAFVNIKSDRGPYVYYKMNEKSCSDEKWLMKLFGGYKKSMFAGVIAQMDIAEYQNKNPKESYALYLQMLGVVLNCAEKNDLYVFLVDEPWMRAAYLNYLSPEEADQKRCRILRKFEYECTEYEHISRTLYENGTTMSVTAVEQDDQDLLDLTEFFKDGRIEWDVPAGNWTINQFVCEIDENSNSIDMLNYDTCMDYISYVHGPVLKKYAKYAGNVIEGIISRGISYEGKNRRMWTETYNDRFIETYGLSPVLYYPALYENVGREGTHYRALMMRYRSIMLSQGYAKAIASYSASRNMVCTGYPYESKATACSWITGDAIGIHRNFTAPASVMNYGYMYGINGVKIAASSAFCYDKEKTVCDVFDLYENISQEVIERETLNIYSRGGDKLFLHPGDDLEKAAADSHPLLSMLGGMKVDLAEYGTQCARTQLMLESGRQAADAALIYPIHSLHAETYLYETSDGDFTVDTPTPEMADYMSVINTMISYVGVDVTVFHPDTLTDYCYAEDGVLYFNNGKSKGKYNTLILPGSSIISLRTLKLIKKFFEGGGKIIATGELPYMGLERTDIHIETDAEAKQILVDLFGADTADSRSFTDYHLKTNEKGGMAYFFYSANTALDGTYHVAGSTILKAWESFGLCRDVTLPNAPKMDFSGALNIGSRIYKKAEIGEKMLSRGSVNCLHKRSDEYGCDIYYFTNTMQKDYSERVQIRGIHVPEEWNPVSGKIHKLACEYVTVNGETCTEFELTLGTASSVFVVSETAKAKELLKKTEKSEKSESK